MVYRWMVSLLKFLEQAIHNFLWIGSISEHKYVTVKWDNNYVPLDEGRLGLKRLHHLNSAMFSKFAWRVFADSPFDFSFL